MLHIRSQTQQLSKLLFIMNYSLPLMAKKNICFYSLCFKNQKFHKAKMKNATNLVMTQAPFHKYNSIKGQTQNRKVFFLFNQTSTMSWHCWPSFPLPHSLALQGTCIQNLSPNILLQLGSSILASLPNLSSDLQLFPDFHTGDFSG